MTARSLSVVLAVSLAALVSHPVLADDAARQLARDSLSFVGRMDALLDGAIRSGDRGDFDRFVFKPTVAQMERWPKAGTDGTYDAFRRCFFALDAFRTYAQNSFSGAARLDAKSPTAKDYAEQKKLCSAAVK